MIHNPLEQSIKEKIEAQGVPLSRWNLNIFRGILTGYNEAFIISGEVKDQLISADAKSADIIRPILRGRDIKRYGYTFADLWLINSHNGVKAKGIDPIAIDDYPAIKRHLNQYYDKLAERADKGDTPYNLRNCAYMDDFSKQKIVWGNLCLSAQFAMVEGGMYINAPSPMIVPGEWYMLAILNSRLADWYIRGLGVTRNGGYFEYKPMFVQQLPVPHLDDDYRKLLNELAKQAQDKRQKGENADDEQNEIDSLVYDLYGIDDEEKAYIQDH